MGPRFRMLSKIRTLGLMKKLNIIIWWFDWQSNGEGFDPLNCPTIIENSALPQMATVFGMQPLQPRAGNTKAQHPLNQRDNGIPSTDSGFERGDISTSSPLPKTQRTTLRSEIQKSFRLKQVLKVKQNLQGFSQATKQHIAISYSSAVLLQGSTTSCWQYLERPKSCIWQSGCFLSLYHVSWKDPGNIVAGWDPMLKMEIINYSLFISEGHSKLQSQERKCEPLRGCANWQFCYIKSRRSQLHLHLQVEQKYTTSPKGLEVKGATRTCEVEPVQNKLVPISNTAILRSLPKLLPEAVCFMVHSSTILKSSPLAIILDDSPMYILLSAHRVIYIEQKQKD